MDEMPPRMTAQWVKEEIMDAIDAKFCHLYEDGMTVAEEHAFRKQELRVARLFGLPSALGKRA